MFNPFDSYDPQKGYDQEPFYLNDGSQLPPVTDGLTQIPTLCTEGQDVFADEMPRSYETYSKHDNNDD